MNIEYGGFPLAETAKDVKAINLSMEYGDWLARFGYVQSKTPFPFPDTEDQGAGPLPGFNHDMKDKFTSLGLQYDNGQLLVMAEVAKRTQNNVPDVYPGDSSGQFAYDIYFGPAGGNYIGKPCTLSKSWTQVVTTSALGCRCWPMAIMKTPEIISKRTASMPASDMT